MRNKTLIFPREVIPVKTYFFLLSRRKNRGDFLTFEKEKDCTKQELNVSTLALGFNDFSSLRIIIKTVIR